MTAPGAPTKEMYAAYEAAMQRRPSPDETVTLLPRHGSGTSVATAASTMNRAFLVTGFGLRNVDSLRRALLEEEEEKRRKRLATMRRRSSEAEEGSYSSVTSQTESSTETSSSFSSSTSKTESKKKLENLMGLTAEAGDEEGFEEVAEAKLKEKVEEEGLEMTEAMRRAQRYLRSHRIFEIFQFLIAHLLGALPEDPIEFITDMLSRCLIFRSGYGDAPLLYDRRHIGELFNLMDPMRTGYIDCGQYVTGMKTLGICTFNRDPPKTLEGCITKAFFVEEAHERLIELLSEMVRRHGPQQERPFAPPPTPELGAPSFALIDA